MPPEAATPPGCSGAGRVWVTRLPSTTEIVSPPSSPTKMRPAGFDGVVREVADASVSASRSPRPCEIGQVDLEQHVLVLDRREHGPSVGGQLEVAGGVGGRHFPYYGGGAQVDQLEPVRIAERDRGDPVLRVDRDALRLRAELEHPARRLLGRRRGGGRLGRRRVSLLRAAPRGCRAASSAAAATIAAARMIGLGLRPCPLAVDPAQCRGAARPWRHRRDRAGVVDRVDVAELLELTPAEAELGEPLSLALAGVGGAHRHAGEGGWVAARRRPIAQ